MATIGGAVSIRNGFDLDFCFEECIKSLLPVCDEVVVSDGESTDGTQEFLRLWAGKEPKIKLCVYPWPNPKGNPDFWVEWLNFTREHLKTDYHIQLDADEVLAEWGQEQIKQLRSNPRRISLQCRRWNFWKDHHHLVPKGKSLSHWVIRVAPANVWMPSDGPHPKAKPIVDMKVNSHVEIFHYGFLRKREAFFKKERALQGFFFNGYDTRLEKAEHFDGNWMTMPGVCGPDGAPGWENNPEPYNGPHPRIMHKWLSDRGYTV